MSGGRLVVLDRLGRDVKFFLLEEGLATIGSGPVCDIRVLLPNVSPHHATVVVHANQTVVRSVSAGGTLVNGAAVSVAALCHGDELTVGDRKLRWEYNEPNKSRPLVPQPALVRRPGAAGRARRRATQPAARPALVPAQRASMPDSSSGKQVAIVQPQRRDTSGENSATTARAGKRLRDHALPLAVPRRSGGGGGGGDGGGGAGGGRGTPLRLAVLRRRVNLTKIHPPANIDHTKQAAIMLMARHTPRYTPRPAARRTPRHTPRHTPRNSLANNTANLDEITDSDTPASCVSGAARRSGRKTPLKSPALPGPKKSSMKDPSAKKRNRKTESIKFDLSNLESNVQDRSSDVFVTDTTKERSYESASEDDLPLHYSDASPQSPSPRRSIHSRSCKILETSLGTTFTYSPTTDKNAPVTESPPSKNSVRGSLIVQKALKNIDSESSRYYKRSIKSMSEQSYKTAPSARKSRTPKISRNLDSYSIVDLVSIDSNEIAPSMYSSMDSNSVSDQYDTPLAKARSTRTELIRSSTPCADEPSTSSMSTRRTASVTTPEDAQIPVAEKSTRVSKVRSRSRINESDLPLEDDNDSPKSSRRNKSVLSSPERAVGAGPGVGGVAGELTPVLSIQRLLEQSTVSHASAVEDSPPRTSRNRKRKTLAGPLLENKRYKLSIKSSSIDLTSRRSQRANRISNSPQNPTPDDEVVTPKSAVKLVPESVKNKHSTAKKPVSKRSIIDNLNVTDFFISPVKRKLSQSMTEFSRKHLSDDEDTVAPSKHTRHTVALTASTPDSSLSNDTEAYTPEMFVSPLSSPGNSPNLSGVRRLFRKTTENDLRNVRGVEALPQTPRDRNYASNNLTNVYGVKKISGKSPNNDLRRVSGVKALFQTARKAKTPKNTLEDVRGVKNLYRKSPRNDLSDVSGVEELFYEPSAVDRTFDQLIGKPRVRSYAKANSFTKITKPAKQSRKAKSLHDSINLITNNVEEWLENELKKRTDKPTPNKSISNSNSSRELQKLTTDTVEGNISVRTSRARHSASAKSQVDGERKKSPSELYSAHTLPIKKRSLVEAEIVGVGGGGAVGAVRLPIKKRVVVHSTPVKGAEATMNASELGRVSPIARLDRTAHGDAALTRLEQHQESPKPNPQPSRGRKPKLMEIPNPEALLQPSLRTRTRPTEASPLPPRRSTRRKGTQKKRSSMVIKKKSPQLTPKPNLGQALRENSLLKTRPTRQKLQDKPQVLSPKKTRSKKVRVVIVKPSPQMKPRSTRNVRKETSVEVKEVKTGRSRKTVVNTIKEKSITQSESQEPARKRGRKVDTAKETGSDVPVKRGRRNVERNENETKQVETTGRGRKKANTITEKQTRGRSVKSQETDSKMGEKENKAPNKRTRNIQKKDKVSEAPKLTMPRGRGAKNSTTVKKVTIAKVTKAKSEEEVASRSRRGKKDKSEYDISIEVVSKGKRGVKNGEEAKKGVRKTRSAVEQNVEAKPKRGRKTAAVEVKKIANEEKGRKKKQAAEVLPAAAGRSRRR